MSWCTLEPVAYKIVHEKNEHTYYIQKMHIDSRGPKWWILLKLNDISSYINFLKEAYDSPEAALLAWEAYAAGAFPSK